MAEQFSLKLQKELTSKFEGLRLEPYRDTVGKLTIGYGRNLEDRGISRPEAEMLLENDLLDAFDLAQTYPFFADLSQVRKAVIVDMIFNLGGAGFAKFEKFHTALDLHDYDLASKEMLNSKWATQVGRRAQTLARMMRENS